MKRKGRKLIMALLALALSLTVGCAKKEEKKKMEKVVNVKVMTVGTKLLRPYVEAVGTLKPLDEVTVSAEVEGVVEKIDVIEGAKVKRGALLVKIKDTDYRLALRQAEAVLKQAEANLANLGEEFRRKEALYREELVTKQQFDDVSARLEVARSEVDRARSARDLAKERLRKTEIFCPLSGLVKEKKVSAGDYVRGGTPLVRIIVTHPLLLNFSVVEKDWKYLKVGQEVSFRVDSAAGRMFSGKIRNLFADLDERTRTLQAEALVPNPREELKAGLFARVIVYTGPPEEKVVIPINALLYEGTQVRVFTVVENRAQERVVKTGQKYGDMMEVLAGLTAGEMLVVVGQNNLAPGVMVHVAR
ncbi:MAG TPA: efflux RND transporter periplasmic adaptor subunit [Syntrophales bacterium]|nr:efflux RND transporter periplasmic adaptor subunit [Syntrophales bacterium]HPO34927.1 efflux RND transporter periplasmic adaptor subunit [Syntrophales bacterium]